MQGRQSVAHDLLNIGSWAISKPEIPGFAPPPHDELAFLDSLGIGIDATGLERCRDELELSHRFEASGVAGLAFPRNPQA